MAKGREEAGHLARHLWWDQTNVAGEMGNETA